jgi:hypothetical protein
VVVHSDTVRDTVSVRDADLVGVSDGSDAPAAALMHAGIDAADAVGGFARCEILTVPQVAQRLGRSTRAIALWIKDGWIVPVGKVWVRGGMTSQLRWGDVYAMLIAKGLPVVLGARKRASEAGGEDKHEHEHASPRASEGEGQPAAQHLASGSPTRDADVVNWGALKRDSHAKLQSLIASAPANAEDQGAAQKWAQAMNSLGNQLAEMESREREAMERAGLVVAKDHALASCHALVERFDEALRRLEAVLIASASQRIVSDGISTDMDRTQRALRAVVSECIGVSRNELSKQLAMAGEKMAV